MLRAKVKTAKTQSTPCDSSKRAVLYIRHELKLHTIAPEDATKTSQQQHLQLQLKRCKMELIAHHWSIFQTVGIFMAYHWTIFPLILFFFFPPLIFPVIPCPSLSALLCPHQDGTQKVQWGSLIRNFHGWLEPTFHRPSLDISLGKIHLDVMIEKGAQRNSRPNLWHWK